MPSNKERELGFWRLEDLPQEEREEAASICEPGELYVGEALAGIRVFRCPFCRKYIHLEKGGSYKGCKHIVFCFDVTNCEYFFVKPAFKRYILAGYARFSGFKGDIEEMASDFNDAKPRDLLRYLPKGTKILENINHYGPGDVTGVVFGIFSRGKAWANRTTISVNRKPKK